MTTLTITPILPPGPAKIVRLADGVSQPQGNGGWSIVKTPKRKGFIDWVGYDPWVMQVPCLLDGFREDRSVERDILELEWMMRVVTSTGTPVVVKLAGPIPLRGLRWVLANIEWGQAYYNNNGDRTRAYFTIEFLQFQEPGVLIANKETSPAAAAQDRAASGTTAAATPPSGRTYTVKRGDTLWAIAARELGKGSRYTEIVTTNNIRDPNNVKVGTVLRLP